MDKSKRVTSMDVAREAGVSRATVSYILNNVQGVSIKDTTKKKVIQAAKKLGYYPDSMAVALKTNKAMSIGIVSRRNISEQRYVKFLDGIKSVLEDQYSIILCSDHTDDFGYPEYYSYYKRKKIDGILFLSYHEHIFEEKIDDYIRMSISEKIPMVFADYHLNNPMVNCVDINYYHGAYMAANYLINNGHKKIVYLTPDFNTKQEEQRIKGIEYAVKEYEDVTLIRRDILTSNEEEKEAIIDILSNRNDYSAIITSWTKMAYTVLYQAQKLKIDIPDEISVIALAGSNFDEYTYPRLCTCNLPLYSLGQKSAKRLIEMLEDTNTLPLNITLPCELKERDSIRSI
ncbi:LacI family transcriptional regulator [Vallitalea longa]|uniref:LacI family transcriptional regulator n=1 Tax=Vallitalea longa TaxID=2936439 RepID=A0A9W6DCX2_9FIRM|nr:LacI family DNA-binding transcriptional regulator [Vallitalea longa]GKX27586.1 LacI family transcriptional regulator [Vallitalea longa]